MLRLRGYQEEAISRLVRRLFLLWRRQSGKSHTLASRALMRMTARRDHLCVFCSASIPLGKEFIRKEAQVWRGVLDKFRAAMTLAGGMVTSNADGLDLDAVADLFEHQKLETKFWFDRTTCSRSIVVAPNPDTAVGWTGDVFMDEVGRIPNLQEVMEAVQPIMSSNPEFIWWLSSTPPPDDKHYSFDLFAPPDETFPVNPLGNWYESKSGILVHRLDAWDGVAGGAPLYDDNTGAAVTPEQHRAAAFDKLAWDRNYALRFILGGSAALSTASIARAMIMGKGQGVAVNVTEGIAL
jgi:hypothetical protein